MGIEDLYKEHGVPLSPRRNARIAVSTLNQWAMDFDGNRDRIIESIIEAKQTGAKYRLGPELEVTGYSCEDHFYEQDTMTHAMDVLAQILSDTRTHEILCSIGMPIIHQSVRYNCDVFILNGKIVGIRPKKNLADDGNYREPRWFTAWRKEKIVENFKLPMLLQKLSGQKEVPIGDFLIETEDLVLGSEKCEEMFTARNPGIDMALDGAELLGNSSGSHWAIRKLARRIELVRGGISKSGGVYAYSNLNGGDGGRLLFDGASMLAVNGELVAQGEQFSMKDVQTLTAVVDFESVESMRGSTRSLGEQADETESFPRVKIPDFTLCDEELKTPGKAIKENLLSPAEEIAKGPALWLWDYLRRSGAAGFFLPLSGGVDSSASASIIGSMCHMIFKEIAEGNEKVLGDLRKIVADQEYEPVSPQEIASKIFFTCYMTNEGTSSSQTLARAENLSKEIGAYFAKADISKVVAALREAAESVTGIKLSFASEGGSKTEDVALQNLQARTRMILSYLLAQVFPVAEKQDGFLLVLGSANVDEANRGYFTKYDCSSADINPIGGLNKNDLRDFLNYAAETFGYKTLLDVLAAAPTAELQPLEGQAPQTDEEDMGMTYDELRVFAKLRKEERMGPLSMFERLVNEWGPGSEKNLSVEAVAIKVKYFFRMYAVNRHKLTTLTPAVHAESYSPDDNRFDLRPFLMNPNWTAQFRRIDSLVQELTSSIS